METELSQACSQDRCSPVYAAGNIAQPIGAMVNRVH